jgi:hypothetical protein
MTAMRVPVPVLPVLRVAALAVTLTLSACAATPDAGPTALPGTAAPATGSPAISPPQPTVVPGGQTVDPKPAPTRIGTTQTEWGEILDAVPDTFPIYPGAGIIELPGALSGSFDAPADATTVARWYEQTLAGQGYAVELSQPLEDGSLVLDARADLPECRIQMTFRPESGSAIMSVLYAAGCAGLGG